MERNIISVKKQSDGKIVTVTRTIEEKYNEFDLVQRKMHSLQQQLGVKHQMQMFKERHDLLTEEMAKCDEAEKQKKSQQQGEIKSQMSMMKQRYDSLTEDIAECDELLGTIVQELPTIE